MSVKKCFMRQFEEPAKGISTCSVVIALAITVSTVMAASDTEKQDQRRVYTRETLLKMNAKLPPCPPLQSWVPLSTPLQQQQSHFLQQDADGEGDNNNNSGCYQRRRGRRGGVRLRLRKNKTVVPLPSVILANVRSFGKNSSNSTFDELYANVKYQSDYRDACLLCFTETWWCADTQPDAIKLDGFGTPFRMDRDSDVTGKGKGGGVAVYVNERWCRKSNVTVREKMCTPDCELLALSMRPTYLPREFGQLFFVVVYVHPQANNMRTAAVIAECVDKLRVVSHDAPVFVLGDGNNCNLQTIMPDFQQYVTCHTRSNKILDKCYGNIKDAYRSVVKAPIGTSDHNTILLLPTYVQKMRRERVETKMIKVWDVNAVEALRGCFASTDWEILIQDATDVSEATEIVSDYIHFCEDMIIPKKVIKIYPNNKPWITKSLKCKILEKNKLFSEKKYAEGKTLQREIKKHIKDEKLRYKDKVEGKLCSGNVRDAWRGLKTLSGNGAVLEKEDGMTDNERIDFTERLNTFYCRFDSHDFSQEKKDACDSVSTKLNSYCVPVIDELTVEKVFKGVNPNKAQGPDAISGRLLKLFHKELAPVFCNIFNISLHTHTVPQSWKAATICPVPKKANPSSLNDYRPIALTSVVMKCFERIVLAMLKRETQLALDPHQFAYRQNRGVEDAVISLLQYSHSHIEQGGSYVRILFVDFSSAFNTVQTHLLVDKLNAININPHLTLWVADFLSNRTQTVCIKSPSTGPSSPSATVSSSSKPVSCSSVRTINTGTPQGTVISPFIFTLYTNDCRSGRADAHVIKFSDDTALIDLSDTDTSYQQSVDNLAQWCDDNFLEMNVEKTKEMIVDYKRNRSDVAALQLKGKSIERVEEYKYLGSIIDNKLAFSRNTEVIFKKCKQRMHIMYQLRSLMVSSKTLELCYHAFVESVLTFSFICWYRTLSVKSRNSLSSIVNVCSKIVGKKQATLEQLFQKRALRKAVSIYSDNTHPLSRLFELLPSNRRFRCLNTRTQRYKNTFIPSVIPMLNAMGSV